MTNWWKQQLDNWGEVDGVDFVPLFFNPKKQKAPNEIYQTNTYEELTTKDVSVPRTNWLPWRMIDGKKFYLDKLGNIIEGPKFEWIKEYDKEEYWGYWILHSCGHRLQHMQNIVAGVVKKLVGFMKKRKKNI